MKLDIKKAFYSIFSHSKWLQNLIIGCLLFGICQILVEAPVVMPYKIFTSAIGSLIVFVLFGYLVQTAHNEINNTNNLSLNWSSCLKYLKFGLYVNLPAYLYTFLLYLLLFPLNVYFIRLLVRHSFSYEKAIVIPLSILMVISYSIFFPYVSAVLAQDFRLKDCFKISNLLLSIKKALPELIKSIGISFFLFVPYVILGIINMFYLNEKLKITFIVFPIYIIIYNLYAQTYKIALNRARS
ncbi:MAG: hypothetical protein A2287_07465 [Candidatus Melainabacteria bacterium RIFOXYA12_FULL_32_12]|nr:MAG: hypothetical protein A2255_09515 [Candidatus Melainabacteria bacterium RIFOXYA2_FULL_32_9]OGI30025.1 MAG: hypothetical protein A2287_07465 [Candidatus Melainabacteria bacterium RIFOXYA12_FULL_32_12]